MPNIQVKTITGADAGTIDLNEQIFNASVNEDLIAQAIYVRLQNARLSNRKTKDRGEVSGGGAKPWRQKGTGRARQGSTRAPHWVGGGHIHALRPGNRVRIMPKVMRRAALFSSLTQKVQQEGIVVVDTLSFETPNTKTAIKTVRTLTQSQKVLVVIGANDNNVKKSMGNIEKVVIREARVLHPLEIVWSDTMVMSKEAVDTLHQMYGATK